jgi:general stress protein YciG
VFVKGSLIMEDGFQMTDNKTEHRGDMGKVAKDREKKVPEAGQKGSQRTQGGHTETQPSQSSEKVKVGS